MGGGKIFSFFNEHVNKYKFYKYMFNVVGQLPLSQHNDGSLLTGHRWEKYANQQCERGRNVGVDLIVGSGAQAFNVIRRFSVRNELEFLRNITKRTHQSIMQ